MWSSRLCAGNNETGLGAAAGSQPKQIQFNDLFTAGQKAGAGSGFYQAERQSEKRNNSKRGTTKKNKIQITLKAL